MRQRSSGTDLRASLFVRPPVHRPSQELSAAAHGGELSRVKSLLAAAPRGSAAALANSRDATGLCALHRAAVGGSQPAAEALLSAGANVNERDSVGWRRGRAGGRAGGQGGREGEGDTRALARHCRLRAMRRRRLCTARRT